MVGSLTSPPGCQSTFLSGLKKCNLKCIALRLVNLSGCQTRSRSSYLILIGKRDAADARIICIYGCQQTSLDELAQGMVGIIWHDARLYIAGQAGLYTDALLTHEIQQ
jgi:hypothetical protein